MPAGPGDARAASTWRSPLWASGLSSFHPSLIRCLPQLCARLPRRPLHRGATKSPQLTRHDRSDKLPAQGESFQAMGSQFGLSRQRVHLSGTYERHSWLSRLFTRGVGVLLHSGYL